MTEREDLVEQIAAAAVRKTFCAAMSWRAAAAGHFYTSDLYGEWWGKASDEMGRLHARLYEIEARISRRVTLRDAAYGRSL